MKKQEFLAASLPYGLNAEFKEEEVKYCRRKVVGTVGAVYNDGSIVCYDTVNACPDKFKPIIRPISDLTKECVQADYNDGKPFIPITELLKASNFNVDKMNFDEQLELLEAITGKELLSFSDGIQLLKWHFWPGMPKGEEVVYVTDEFNPYK